MADISHFTSKFRAQKPHPSESRVTKSTRPRLVCNPCQLSKLRCDRGQPCSSCVRRGDGDNCSYRQTGPKEDERLAHLESMVKLLIEAQQGQSKSPARSEGGRYGLAASTTAVSGGNLRTNGQEKGFNRDGNRSSTYAGSTHWSTILDDIQELKVMLDSGASSEEMTLTTTSTPLFRSDLIFGSANDYSLQEIISQYLPPKLEVDRYLATYFQGHTFIVIFIHTAQFQREYQAFWASMGSVNPLWLSMLFSICYLGSLGRRAESLDSLQNDGVAMLSRFHFAAGQCLVLGEYHRPQPFAIEALTMYGHCTTLSQLDPSREAGTILGMLVRMAYEMGYHRDPDAFGSFTVFEGEMRRRLWATIKQMDLMISFQLGLPSNICLENCDTRSPCHLLDSDFDVDAKVLPPSRPENEATRLLWFIVKERIMPSFAKVCQDALSFKRKSIEEILLLHQEIQDMHKNIPEILRARPISDSIADPPFLIMTRLYIDFMYLKSLCVLHRKYMARGNALSTRACAEASTKLVGQFIDMHKELAPGGLLYMQRWMLNNFNMNDFLLGIMVLCLVVYTYRKRGPQDPAIDTATESEMLAMLEQAHAICVERSTTCKGARRVSHAIQLTLSEANSSNMPRNVESESSVLSPAATSAVPATGNLQAVDAASLWSMPWYGYTQDDDDTSFGPFYPFNFTGNEIENVDWSTLDLQI